MAIEADHVRSSKTMLDDVQKRLCALRVRVECNQHTCSGPECDDPNHRRDVNYLEECLRMLGLPLDFPSVSDAERETLLTARSAR